MLKLRRFVKDRLSRYSVMISHSWIRTKHAVYDFYFKQSQAENSPRNERYPRSDRSIGSARKKTHASTNVLKKACLKNRSKFQELRLPLATSDTCRHINERSSLRMRPDETPPANCPADIISYADVSLI